jgi:tetratricopeptide (TPR) repeat protein
MSALLMLLLAAAPAAVELNTEGFRLYRKGEFVPALEKFKQAVAADERYALAHYNAAATMARLQGAADPCSGNSENFDILGELKRAIELDPARRKRALVDPDFKPLLGTLAYRRLLYGVTEKTNLRLLLEGTTFSSFAGWGSFGNSVSLRFLPKGKLLLGLRQVVDEPFSNTMVDHPGTWRVEGNTLHVCMSRAADKAYDGKATFAADELEFPVLGKLVNYVSGACDA